MISESEQDIRVTFPVAADRNMQNKHKNNRLFRHTKQAVASLFNKKCQKCVVMNCIGYMPTEQMEKQTVPIKILKIVHTNNDSGVV